MVWLPRREIFLKIRVFVSIKCTYVTVTDGRTDRQMDGQTPRDGIGARLCIASRGKNENLHGFVACCQRCDRQVLYTQLRHTVTS